MKRKLALLVFFIAAFSPVYTQTIYQLKFKSPASGNETIYEAYFSVSSNGTGFVRIKPANSKLIIEMEILEQYANGSTGGFDTSMLVYEGMNAKIVMGDKKASIPAFTFWFTLTPENLSEPWGVTETANDPVPEKNNFLSTEFIKSQELIKNKKFVLNFFSDTSSYFKNVFGPKSKGGSLGEEERKNTRMFLVLVASTRDETLMPNCKIDAGKMVGIFSDIAKNVLNIRLFVDSIYGDSYNKPRVEASLKKLKPGKNDIVIFYYSGHGFTDRKETFKDYPFLDLRDPTKRPRPDARTQTLNIQDIYDTIIRKGARLNLILSDCCNDTIEAKKSLGPKLPGQKGMTKANFDNVKALFMNKTPINLLMTAASKDQRAIITPTYSSYFTHFFIESLKTYLSPEKSLPNWFQVLGEAQKQTRLYADRANWAQTPKLLLPR
ncbi:MAG: caspase family protein [Chitinophagaceae bacterium]|nr:caspase family protein [Chitinophagaceae bacterium]